MSSAKMRATPSWPIETFHAGWQWHCSLLLTCVCKSIQQPRYSDPLANPTGCYCRCHLPPIPQDQTHRRRTRSPCNTNGKWLWLSVSCYYVDLLTNPTLACTLHNFPHPFWRLIVGPTRMGWQRFFLRLLPYSVTPLPISLPWSPLWTRPLSMVLLLAITEILAIVT